jgi:predicted lipid-binding transport protein (Tim44 family)
MPYYISPPPSGPVARFVGAIVAVLAMAGAVMLGMVAFLVIAGIGLVLGLVVWLRLIWIRRRLHRRRHQGPATSTQADSSSEAIEAEYTVVSRDRD